MGELRLSVQYKNAVDLNEKIIFSGQMAQGYLWEMCRALKEMRDSKLYKELGYHNFEEYCEKEVGMKRRNAYNYISIAERINPENVQPVAQIGIKKLALLSTLSEEQQKEVSEAVDLESTTYRELKAEIARLKEEKQKADKAAADANQQRIAMQSDLLSAKSKNRSLSHELEEAKKMSGDAKGLAARLKDVERELSVADQDNYNKLEAQRIEYQKKINALQKQLDNTSSMREVAVETIPDYEAVFKAYYHAAVMAIKEMMRFLKSLAPETQCHEICFDMASDLSDAFDSALCTNESELEEIYKEEGII